MHDNKNLLLSAGSLAFAIFFLIACLAFLGMRNDGERILFPEAKTPDHGIAQTTFDTPVNSRIAVFVCAPEQDKTTLEDFSQVDIQTLNSNGTMRDVDLLPITSPMPLDIPAEFAEKHQLSERVFCGDSEIVNLDEPQENSVVGLPQGTSAKRKISIPQESFVVAAVSDPRSSVLEKLLFFFFLAALWGGIARFSQQFRFVKCQFKRYDFILAFGLGNLIALLLIQAAAFLPFPSDTLLPGYGEMLVMLFVNFVGFLATAAFFVWLRKPRKTPWLQEISCDTETKSLASAEQSKDTAQPTAETIKTEDAPSKENHSNKTDWVKVKLRYPILLGIGIAIVGTAFVMMLVEQPGLTTFTMASQLVSTMFLTGIFAILAAISEESVFRGIIQASLEAKPGSKNPLLMNCIAVAIATLLFVGMHVPQSIDHLWALVPIAAVSITSGILKIQYRTIFPCILLHMTYNATLVVPGIFIA